MAEMFCVSVGCTKPCHGSGNRFCADHAIEFLQRQLKYAEAKQTLRDYFAGQALAGIGTWMPEHGGSNLSSKAAMQARALWAYEQADAMLAERSD